MRKILVVFMMVACVIACTGCGFHEITDEEIERKVCLDLYEQVTGKDGENLSITQMRRDMMKVETEKEHVCYWTYEGTEYDRIQTVHSYLDDGTKFYIVYDLDTGDALDYGTED